MEIALEYLQSLFETLEILSDQEFHKSIQRGEMDIETGNKHDWEEFKASISA